MERRAFLTLIAAAPLAALAPLPKVLEQSAFASGDQWSPVDIATRKAMGRPVLTHDELGRYVKSIEVELRGITPTQPYYSQAR